MTHPHQDTLATTTGRDPARQHGLVNPPLTRGSTVLWPTLAEMEASDRAPLAGVHYGRIGTPTSRAFEQAVAELEQGFDAVSTPSGLSAITTALSAFVQAGDHVLVTDSVYYPTRRFCDDVLARWGVTTEYFDPLIGTGIGALIKPNTRVVMLESPGSLTFEIQDLPAITAAVRAARPEGGPEGGIVTMIDNTWATPLYLKPFAYGVDVSLHAATKYLVGHSDALLGVIVCRDQATWDTVKQGAMRFGVCAGPDDLNLGLRGLRTLAVRLARHGETGLALADWLARRPEIVRVIHPARPGDPGYPLWQRDFTGTSGLFGAVLQDCPKAALAAFLDSLELFGKGYSWGGFESLAIPARLSRSLPAYQWREPGRLVRFHAGLEHPDDLIRDLEQALARWRAAL